MTDAGKIIKEWEAVLSRDPLDAPFDLIDETLTVLKEQQREIESMNFIYGFVYGGQVKEVRELVRCKDCKHWTAERMNDYNKCKRWINVGVKNFATIGDWFCADGEREVMPSDRD